MLSRLQQMLTVSVVRREGKGWEKVEEINK